MKTSMLRLLTILSAAGIVIILGVDGYLEKKSFDDYMKQKPITVMIHYDGGWVRPLSMLLAVGVITFQIVGFRKQGGDSNHPH